MERINTEQMNGTERTAIMTNRSAESGTRDIAKEYAKKDLALSGHYDKISKDGDTLEISKDGGTLLKRGSADDIKTISTAELISASATRLKQLYTQQQITKQQYEKYMKQKTESRAKLSIT